MRKYNQQALEAATLELENQFLNAAQNHNKLLEERANKQAELKQLKETESLISGVIDNYNKDSVDSARRELEERNKVLNNLKVSGQVRGEALEKLEEEQKLNGEIREALGGSKKELLEQLGILQTKSVEEEESLLKKDQEIAKTEQIYQKLQLQYLKNAGINEEVARRAVQEGNTLQTLDQQIDRLQKSKEEIKNTTPANERNTDEYKNQIAAIDGQISEMQTAKGNLIGLGKDARNYTKELGRDVDKYVSSNLTAEQKKAMDYNRELRERVEKILGVDLSPSASSIDSDLSKTSYKTVEVSAKLRNSSSVLGFYDAYNNADGTNFHPGGLSWLGEEGPELVKRGRKWSIASFGLYDLERGAKVFTHEQSKKIWSGLNQFPQYAGGVGVSDSMARRLNDMSASLVNSRQSINNNLTINVGVGDVIMDGRTVGSIVWRPVQENMNRNSQIIKDFKGG
ncbi:hypothetical protein PD280_21370 [Virgibacillus salarius]|uniref:hypothetical protein n=1 Tax=Virgibacillus salarius TaxID=447199 RepID=UPI00249299D8|nr:hypothetical protein [Virgibacillus salarius]WBX80119.1 hypothetical protein PD280_21370 [Virgibacillus salarius]